MRRIVAPILIALVAAACTTTNVDTTPVSVSTTAPTTTTTTTSPAPEPDPCPVPGLELDRIATTVGLSHLAGGWNEEAGPLTTRLAAPEVLATEIGYGCSGAFVSGSELGEAVQIHAAWDADGFAAVAGGYAIEPPFPDPDAEKQSRTIAELGRITFNPISDRTLATTPHGWRLTESLEGFLLFDGDPPEQVMEAWGRGLRNSDPAPVLRFTNANSDGSHVVPDYVLYEDGTLITPGPAADYLATFKPGIRINQLTPEQVAEIREAALATHITDGASFEKYDTDEGTTNPSFGTFPYLAITYWHNDVGYLGFGQQLGEDETRDSRLRALDLERLLKQAVRSSERTNWMEGDVVVRVEGHGLYDDANAMEWLGEFNLAGASGQGCILLQGEEADAYRADVALVGDEYQHVLKTFFDYDGQLHSVYAIPLLPGDPAERMDKLSRCSDSRTRTRPYDPTAVAWLWGQRGIDEYELFVRPYCVGCDGAPLKLDGATPAEVPGWFELSSVDDLFALARDGRFELTDFSSDGIVGIPLVVELGHPETGETLRLLTTRFTSERGLLDIEHEQGEIWISPQGFDEWRPWS
ncbi:MAG: hypothetical protein GY722_24550 [bacterium]|nr:hypothetical protein [bacterium]